MFYDYALIGDRSTCVAHSVWRLTTVLKVECSLHHKIITYVTLCRFVVQISGIYSRFNSSILCNKK